MAKDTRRTAVGAGLTAAWLLVALPLASAQTNSGSASVTPTSRIRTDSAILKGMIHRAFERSRTFRAVVAAIDASDGIVYVRVGSCGRPLACLLHRVTVAGPNRLLTALVDVQRSEAAVMAALGHEFQHAREVLSDPRITSDADLLGFYLMRGFQSSANGRQFETREAIDVGTAIGDELRRAQEDNR